MSINYKTKFSIGDSVKITRGLYKGREGKVEDYSPNNVVGHIEDCFARDVKIKSGTYKVKSGWFDSISVLEEDMDWTHPKEKP